MNNIVIAVKGIVIIKDKLIIATSSPAKIPDSTGKGSMTIKRWISNGKDPTSKSILVIEIPKINLTHFEEKTVLQIVRYCDCFCCFTCPKLSLIRSTSYLVFLFCLSIFY